jgi:serine/threonine-protein kinase
LRQACDALHEAHQAGLVHRDLKPPNIFAAYRGARFDVAKLLDFGLVKPMKDEGSPVLTREGAVTGSPLYMAPEQVMRIHEPDARTDIYSMGGIAYFLLSGQPPFVSSDSMTVMVAHARDPVVPPSRIRADIPADLEKVVLQCLEKNPDRRYQNAEGLARALSACQAASSWTAELAAAWWQASEPQVCEGEDHASSPRPALESVDLTQKDGTPPTLAASEVEAVFEPDSSLGTGLSVSVIEDDARPERSR